MKKTEGLILFLSVLTLAGCDDLLETPYNHFLDSSMALELQDYFEFNTSDTSIGASGVASIVEYKGQYVTSYGSSGPYLSSTKDFETWTHYPDDDSKAAPSALLTDGSVLLAESNGSIMVIAAMGSELSYEVHPPPQEDIRGWRSLVLHGGILYALEEGGLYSSDNYGKAWTSIPGSYQDSQSLAVDDKGIYIVQEGEIWVQWTADRGVWSKLEGVPSDVKAIYVEGTNAFVSTESGDTFLSSGGFENYSTASVGLPITAKISSLYSRGDRLLAAAADNQRLYLYTISTGDLKDLGSLKGDGSSYFPTIQDLYIAEDGTLLISTQGGLWISQNDGAAGERKTHFSGLLGGGVRAFHLSSNTAYVVTTSGEAQAKRGGASWFKLDLPDVLNNYNCSSIFSFGDHIYISGGSHLVRSRTGTAPWDILSIVPGADGARQFTADDTNIYAATSEGVYKSNDGGMNWTATTNTEDVEKVFYDGAAYLYALSAEKVARSNDGGQSWVDLNLDSPTGANNTYTSIGQLGNFTYIGRGNEILRSGDGFSSSVSQSNSQGALAFLNIEGELWMKTQADSPSERLQRIQQGGGDILSIELIDHGGFDGDILDPQTSCVMSIQNDVLWISDNNNLHFGKIVFP